MKFSIEIIWHHDKNDKEYIYDYHYVDLLVNGTLAKTYGDYYHDKGREKIQGFIDAIKYLHGDNCIVSEKHSYINDSEY